MKIALSSYSGYGSWFTLRLLKEGHKVDYFLSKPEYSDILEGIVPTPFLPPARHHGNAHASYPPYKNYNLSVFDLTGRERQAEYSALHCPTIGDSAFAGVIEEDRLYGIKIMEECGIPVPPYAEFDDIGAAKAFVKSTKKRYVYKPDGGQDQDTATTYVSKDSEDMLHYLDKAAALTHGAKFILQEFIAGTEASIEGWFNGDDFYLLNCTLEEKKFMNKNHGPNTGCSGNLLFNFGLREPKLYKEGLCKMKDFLRSVSYRGMLDLNTIVTENKIYGLEWTPRFGYDASAAFLQMYSGNFGDMMLACANGDVPTTSWRAEFCAGVRLSIPPYPSEIPGRHIEGISVAGIEPEDYLHTFMYDVKLNNKNELITAGHSGFIATPMGIGDSVAEAFAECDARIKRIKIPNMQIRTDIEQCALSRYYKLDKDGWLK
jgi:phosphoribosylamine--glycine ligase